MQQAQLQQAPKVSNRERVVQLIMLTESLSEIIHREAETLSQRRPAKILDFEAEKTRLAQIYANEMTRFRKDTSLMADVPKGLLDDLKTATGKLRDRLDRQSTILTGLKTVSERLVHAIANEVTKARVSDAGYGSNAGYARAPAGSNSFALNRTA
jgi:hypothetical protein